jgi:hypothetical protein
MLRLRCLLNLFRRADVSQAIDDELRYHIDERSDTLMARGLSEREARRQATHRFGNVMYHTERTREFDLPPAIENLFEDVRYAVRSLRRSPAFTIAAVATFALGIGATTAILSAVRSVWLRPLPYASPDRVVRIWERNARLDIGGFSASPLNFLSWQERTRSFESLIAVEGIGRPISVNGQSTVVIGLAPSDMGFAGDIDVWEPLVIQVSRENRADHHVVVLGRLKRDVTVSQADAELNQLGALYGSIPSSRFGRCDLRAPTSAGRRPA